MDEAPVTYFRLEADDHKGSGICEFKAGGKHYGTICHGPPAAVVSVLWDWFRKTRQRIAELDKE